MPSAVTERSPFFLLWVQNCHPSESDKKLVRFHLKKKPRPPPLAPKRTPSSSSPTATNLIGGLNPLLFLSLDASKAPPPQHSDSKYFYQDPSGTTQGPFSEARMQEWYNIGAIPDHLKVKLESESAFTAINKRAPPFAFARNRPTPPTVPPLAYTYSYASAEVDVHNRRLDNGQGQRVGE